MLGFFYYATLRLGCVYTYTEAVEFFSNCGLFGQGVRKRVKGIGRFASKKTSKEHEWTNQAGKFWLQMQLLWTGEQKWQVQEPMGHTEIWTSDCIGSKGISYILVDLWTDKSTKPTLFLLICGKTKLYTWLKTRTCTKTRWSIPTYHISIKSTRLTTTEIREGRAGVCRDSIACYYSTIVLPHGQVPQFTNWCVDVPPKRKSCIDSRTRICWKTHYPLVKHRTTHCEMVQALELQIF